MSMHFTTKPGYRTILAAVLALLGSALTPGCRDGVLRESGAGNEIRQSHALNECAGRCVNLRTLIISTGNASEDSALNLVEGLHERMGVPYAVLDSSRKLLTAEMLWSGNHGYYNAIILTNSTLWDEEAPGKSGFSAQEWALLHDYERRFSVRESVVSGHPAIDANLGLNYGMVEEKTFTHGKFSGVWHKPAGGTELFEKINSANPLPLEGYAVGARERNSGSGPQVDPLLTERESGAILVARLRYPDGREVLFSTLNNAPRYLHSQLLAYEFLNFASKGVFIGARKIYLNAHVDDLFLPNFLWDPDTNDIDRDRIYRMTPSDAENTAKSLRRLRNRYPTARNLKLDFAFNGKYWGNRVTVEDELFRELSGYNGTLFRYINHTLTHHNMDLGTATDYQKAKEEIEQNMVIWRELDLPEFEQNRSVLVTGEHSGLRNGDTPYPEGKNDAFLQAARDAGVRYLASDASQPNQNLEQFIQEFDILLLPRYPTALFYNVTEPDALTDEYNYMFHERHLEQGLRPADVPGANSGLLSYREIMEIDTDQALRNMLGYSIWPHYFHQSNLQNYDQKGKTLLFDWLETLFDKYQRLTTLPVISLPYHEVGRLTENRLAARDAGVSAVWNLETDEVTVSAQRNAGIFVTGLAGGEYYGGQLIRPVIADSVPRSFTVDRALDK